ncbi:MAG: AAA family ATPase [Syntrophaceae bacterium]|nr:AAA family ATPase [Syntrophaceae bacterium]
MEKLGDYILHEKIQDTRNSNVYRGHKENETHPLIIKQLKTRHPSPSEIAQFRQEYEQIKGLDIKGIVRTIDIISYNNTFAIVLEDFDGVSIKSLQEGKKKFALKSFLEISAKIAETLGSIHTKGVFHRDIKPHNILINPSTNDVKITDFGISAILTHENKEIYNPDFIADTLSYMSPEQTGMMNRTVDYRTDLYSFGVTLYEMITGYLPFKSQDPMDLIHSHIAIMPIPPAKLDHGIPDVVSDIIIRMLAKNPEERYQNAFGLEADFRQCLKQLEEKKSIEPFELGKRDISYRFIIPPKLYGREKELGDLLSSFEAVANRERGTSVMVVAGAPGIGKSAMVNEIHKPIVARKGYFISGKYEQFRRDKPYSAIIQAFQVLVKHILSESKEKIGLWKNNLLDALGTSGKIITDVIPEVELIIGKQPELPELNSEESKNRFNFVFEKFMRVFPQKEHPVVLFLDDLQWADMASLQLMKNILPGDIQYLFIIFSYRDNEVDETHPVADFLKEAQKANIKIDRIMLEPLKEKDVKDLTVNFLRCSEEKGAELARLVQKKTGGNPFFVNQFLHTLYNEKMIVLDGARGWKWDTESINRMRVTDNLVEMMAGKIVKLPVNTKEVLKICACISNRFDLETLASVRDTSVEKALGDLTPAINDGLVSQFGDMYVFHHDRIQEAAYSLVTDSEKSALHYRIGKLTLEKGTGDELQNKLFYIVDQLNLGVKMVTNSKDREELARLNLEAGKKAKSSAAYAPAFGYLKSGIELLEDNPWEKQYDLTVALYIESTEAAYLMGNYDTMNKLAEITLERAKTTLEKVKIFTARINACIAREDYRGAINAAMPSLELFTSKFGIKIPQKTTKIHIGIELFLLLINLLWKKPEDILNMPKATDPEILAAGKILASVGHAAFYDDPNLLALIILKSNRQAFKYGLAPEHAFGFTSYGIVRAVLFDLDGAVEFGKLGFKLMEKLDAKAYECRIIFVYNALIRHWKYSMKESIEPFLEGYRTGLETGDLGFATFNLFFTEVHNIFSGMDISELSRYMERNNKIIGGLKQGHTFTLQSMTWQSILNLLGECDNPIELTGRAIDAEKLLPSWEKTRNLGSLSVYWFIKLILYSLYNEYPLALQASDQYRKYMDSQQGNSINRYAVLLDSVARLMVYKDVSLFKKLKFRVMIGINQLKFWIWARSAPMNCLHMYHAVRAKYAWSIHGNIAKAEKILHTVVALCRQYGDFVVEGIANEIIARTYRQIGDEQKAKHFMNEAYRCYSKWGATGLLDKLHRLYPHMIPSSARISRDTAADRASSTSDTLATALDLSTVMQVSQVISSEIMLDKLLQKIMHISIVNAGAQRGYLLLVSSGELTIEASEDVNTGESQVMQSVSLKDCADICQAIVNYVYRSGKDIVLGNASQEGSFMNDPYIMEKDCKSILCTPIISKGMISGILYMENNLTTNTFTPERLEILRIISAQAAISIENARLFEMATTLEKIQDGYFEVDLAGNYTFVNDSLCQLHGYSKEELLGMNYQQCSDKENAKKVFQAFNEVYKTGEPLKGFGYQTTRKDGTKRYIEVSTSLQKDSTGKPIGFRGISRDITERKQMEEKLQQTLESVSKAYDSTIQVMVSAVEIRDPYTALHQVRSADIARDIAKEMGLSQDIIDGIRMAGAIHDIGKLSIPPDIWAKSDKLTNVEFALIKEHSRSGYEMLKNVESPWPLAKIVHQHHERMNGSGYPRNLKGDEILMEARVLAVADVVSAMVSHRPPYRSSLGIETALEEIEKNRGILYDATVVDACLRLFREKGYKIT